MPNVNYYLKEEDSQGNRLIYMIVKYSNNRFKYSFGCSIGRAAKWDGKRIKAGADADKNKILDKYRQAFEEAFAKDFPNEPDTYTLKLRMDEFKASQKTNPTKEAKSGTHTFYGLFRTLANKCRKETTVKNHLAVMERMQEKWPDLDFKNIDASYLEAYRGWLKKENAEIKTTTINAYLNIIKKVVIEANKKKLMRENPFNDFELARPDQGDKDAVALTKAEVKMLIGWKAINKSLDKCRDWFLIGCFTGLRSEDLRNLSMKNVVNGNTIKIKTSKTGEMFDMPAHPEILRIIKKYNNNFPKQLSSQQFNISIKEVCMYAGLKETGVLTTDLSKALWQCVQAHSSRRTFVTMSLYEDKIPAATVIKWTLHKNESMLWAYAKPRVKASSTVAIEMHRKWEMENERV